MKEYQRITLKETGEEMVVSSMEYPYTQAGILYLKFIRYNANTLEPTMFVTIQPQDILKRVYSWSREAEDELISAADDAAKMETNAREMYQKAAEEEMARRAALIDAPDEHGGDHEGLFG